MSRALENRTAVVTGSTSGIGRAIAHELAQQGARVVVHGSRDPSRVQAVAKEIQAMGGDAATIMGDISKPEDREQLVRKASEILGELHIWVNNAGADILTGEAAQWPFEKKLARLWEVDVLGTIGLSRLAGERMLEGSPGIPRSIVNLGWDQATRGMQGEPGQLFGTTKGAVMAFTASLARTLAPHVRVNCVAPGWIRTKWGVGASEYWQERARRESLLDRWGEPSDVAKAVAYLVSDQASFITGQTIEVNGGFRHAP